MIKHCKICENEFKPNNNNQKTCSKECSKINKKYNKKIWDKNNNWYEFNKTKALESQYKYNSKNSKIINEKNKLRRIKKLEEINLKRIDNGLLKLEPNEIREIRYCKECNKLLKLRQKSFCSNTCKYIYNKKINPNYNKKHREWNKEWFHKKENKRRKGLGLPLVGEGFKTEMELFYYIKKLFIGYKIIIHDRNELNFGGRNFLELDFYLPELKLGFEYMGGHAL